MNLNLDITTLRTTYYKNRPFKENDENINAQKTEQKTSFSSYLATPTVNNEVKHETHNLQDWNTVFKGMQEFNQTVNIDKYKSFMAKTSYGNLKTL